MANFYIKYTPARRGLTGAEYLPQYLEETFPSVTYDDIASDGKVHFGILSGSGDDLSKVLALIEGKFSAFRLSEDELVGYCYMNYDPQPMMDGETPPTFTEMMQSHGITVSDTLAAVKLAKINLFKEISRKKCEPDNDCIADLAKCVTLFEGHYDDLTTEEKTAVDANMSTLKSYYDKQTCIDAFDKLVNITMGSILVGYYTKKQEVMNATSEDDAIAVVYE